LPQAISDFDFSFETPVVRRINFERVMKAQCDVERGKNTIALFNSLRRDLEQNITLPDGYRMEVYGEEESRSESNDALTSQLPIAMVLMFVILVLLFGELRAPLVVFATLPLIFIGVVAGLAVTGKMFDFFSLLGLLGLVGMNVKNGVILLSRIAELRSGGIEPRRSIIEATQERFVPVVVASATTVLGISPLLFDSMFGGMAATIMGGLVVATLLVLIVLPVVYSLIYRIR
jgi:multidrug efflux pump subunit AcrB